MHKVQCSQLGSNGRFGNQLFQYAFARTYADKFGYELEIPLDWEGRSIFGIDAPPISCKMQERNEGDNGWFGDHDIDLTGYFTTRNYTKYMDRSEIRKWFYLENYLDLPERYTAVHLRRTDYSTIGTISKECVEHWIDKFNVTDPIIYLSDDTSLSNINELNRKHHFLDDFLIMINSTNLFRCHSTFSWWAGELSNSRVLSPIVFNKLQICVQDQFVDFVEGNHPALCPRPFIVGQEDSKFYDIYFGE